jgi:hypothetical protein
MRQDAVFFALSRYVCNCDTYLHRVSMNAVNLTLLLSCRRIGVTYLKKRNFYLGHV